MFTVRIEAAVFSRKIQEYQRLTGKAMGSVVRDQARLLADRLTQLTYPKTASQGKKRVAVDVAKVYLGNKWFEEQFQFRSKSLGDRVKAAVRAKDETALRQIFERGGKLSRLHVEPFDAGRIERLRKNGRVNVPTPFSFPVSQQGQVSALVKQKQKAVGIAKSGWAQCSAQLGKSVPSWLSKSGAGEVKDRSGLSENPTVTITNRIRVFAELDSRANIVSRALAGRGRDMIKSAERLLKEAARQAALN